MKIAEFSVKNWQFTVIIFVMVMAIGLNSLLNMPRGEDPSFKSPQFVIVAIYPGTSPTDMEELVVDPIEDKVNELENIKKVISNIDDGLAVVRVEFTYDSDPDDKFEEVLREINNLRPSLPEGLYNLEVQQITPSDVNILQVALLSETAPYKDLEEQAENLQERLEKIKSLKKVDTWAHPEQQVQVSLDLQKMAQRRIPLGRVLNAIGSENANIPGGSVEIGPMRFNVKTSGDYGSMDEIRNTVVQATPQGMVLLKDVADVSFGYEEESYLGRLNGKRAVFVTASQKDGGNIFRVQDQIYPVLEAFRKELPANIRFEKSFDQSESVSHRLSGFARDFGIAIFLVLLTLLPLGFRASVVVMISIPLSLAIGLALLDWFGFSINQLSIVGLVVALGLLVDDSIVVVENIARFLRLGYSRKDAAIQATRQIGVAVVGCTATLIFAFLPLMFLPEAAGDFIRSLPAAVVATVLASLFVSLTIVPFLASLILKEEEEEHGNFFMRGLHKLISGSYRRLLHAAIAHPYVTLGVAFLIFAGSIALMPVVGFSLFPKSDKPQFLITIDTPLGTSLYETDRVARYVESVLNKKKHIRNYATNVGKGNPRIYYNVIQKNEAANYAEIFVQLEEIPLPEIEQFVEDLRKDVADLPNATIQVRQFEQGPPIDAPVAIRVFGENLDSLRTLAFRVEKVLKNTPGTIYVENPLTALKTDLQVHINKDKAAMLGVPIVDIDRTVRMGIAGIPAGTYRENSGDEYTINVSLPREQRPTLKVFDNMYVASLGGALIPLSQLATVELSHSPIAIRHYDKDRFVTITAFVQNGYLTDNVTEDVLSRLANVPFPEGYRYVPAGEVESRSESFGGLGTIIIITIFGILAILILEFKTFKSTLIVLSVIPLGIVGAVLILLFTGNSLSFTATIGLIALMGIEIKNSILLVDYTNQLREGGLGLDEAIEVAGETRFVPIILTTLTAIGGLIPLVLERSPLYSPLALVLIGGLISSTLLTRVVTPVLYKLLAPAVEPVQEAVAV